MCEEMKRELDSIMNDPLLEDVTPKNIEELCDMLNDNSVCGIEFDPKLVKALCDSIGLEYIGDTEVIAKNDEHAIIEIENGIYEVYSIYNY